MDEEYYEEIVDSSEESENENDIDIVGMSFDEVAEVAGVNKHIFNKKNNVLHIIGEYGTLINGIVNEYGNDFVNYSLDEMINEIEIVINKNDEIQEFMYLKELEQKEIEKEEENERNDIGFTEELDLV